MTAIAVTGRFASSVIPVLIDKVINKDKERLGEQLKNLIEANALLGNSPIGFLFGGNFHSLYDKTTQAKAVKRPLHPSLNEQGHDFLQEMRKLGNDIARLKSGLSLLLRPCENWQDVRDALPDVVRDELQEIRDLRRTRKEGWTLEAFPLQRMQFQTTIDLLTYHIANRLLY